MKGELRDQLSYLTLNLINQLRVYSVVEKEKSEGLHLKLRYNIITSFMIFVNTTKSIKFNSF